MEKTKKIKTKYKTNDLVHILGKVGDIIDLFLTVMGIVALIVLVICLMN